MHAALDGVDRAFPVHPELHKSVQVGDGGSQLFSSLLVGSLADVETTWRVSPIFAGPDKRSVREFESIHRVASFRHFSEWMSGGELHSSHPFQDLPSFSAAQVSLYADYKHTNDLFKKEISDGCLRCEGGSIEIMTGDSAATAVSWKGLLATLGIAGESIGKEDVPTLWVGSRSAHSPLHYDTYGKNMVVQLQGRKRWLLWPPAEPSLNELRVPYEESSVYCELDPMAYVLSEGELAVDFKVRFPGVYDFTLEEGDVLLVPPHWWHFVVTESDASLSCNLWIENQPADGHERVKEAATKFVFGALQDVVQRCGIDTTDRYAGWVNPAVDSNSTVDGDTTRCCDHTANLDLLLAAIKGVHPPGESSSVDDNVEDILKTLVETIANPLVMQEYLGKVLSDKNGAR